MCVPMGPVRAEDPANAGLDAHDEPVSLPSFLSLVSLPSTELAFPRWSQTCRDAANTRTAQLAPKMRTALGASPRARA